jgi:hypothetical protein
VYGYAHNPIVPCVCMCMRTTRSSPVCVWVCAQPDRPLRMYVYVHNPILPCVCLCVCGRGQGGAGDKHFLASADLGEWHFVALSYNASTSTACAYVDGQGSCGRATGTRACVGW